MKIRSQIVIATLLTHFFCPAVFAQNEISKSTSYLPIGSPITVDESHRFLEVGDDFQITFDQGVPYLEFEQNAYYPEMNLWTRYDSIDLLIDTMNRGFVPLQLESGGYHYNFSSIRSFKSVEADRVVFDFLGLIREYSRMSLAALDLSAVEPLKVKFVTADLVTMVGPITSVLVQAHGQFGSQPPWSEVEYLTFNVDTNERANLLEIVDEENLIWTLKSDYYLTSLANKTGLSQRFSEATTIQELDFILSEIFRLADEPVTWKYDPSEPLKQFTKFALYDFNPEFETLHVWIGLEFAKDSDNLQFRNLTLQLKPNAQFLKVLRKIHKQPGNSLFRDQAQVRTRYR